MNYIETERLILRYIEPRDELAIYNNYANDDEVTKYLIWKTHENLDATRNVIKFWEQEDVEIKKYHYFIVLKNTNELIGSCSVADIEAGVPEIGYVLGRKYWGQGIMTEACRKLIEILFNDGYKKISIKARIENIGSNSVIKKCGFKFIKQETKVYSPFKKEEWTCNLYELSLEDQLISYCGLNCLNCEARLATINNDDELRQKVAKKWSEWNKVEIKPEDINCLGCRVGEIKSPFAQSLCPIRMCAIKEKVCKCEDCKKANNCSHLDMIKKNN